MIFGIKEKSIILSHTIFVGYCYKYTCVIYDWFCAQGHILLYILHFSHLADAFIQSDLQIRTIENKYAIDRGSSVCVIYLFFLYIKRRPIYKI